MLMQARTASMAWSIALIFLIKSKNKDFIINNSYKSDFLKQHTEKM